MRRGKTRPPDFGFANDWVEELREFGLARETVRKMLRYSIPPGYLRKESVRRPKLGPWLGVIDATLEEDKNRPVKQRHTAKRIFDRLRQEYGFTGGYTIGNLIPGKTCANECCTNTFASFSSPQMSSCSYWKTARSDAQTTARGHRDRACGNIVHPSGRLADSLDEIPFPAGMPRNHQRRPRRKSSAPIG